MLLRSLPGYVMLSHSHLHDLFSHAYLGLLSRNDLKIISKLISLHTSLHKNLISLHTPFI